MPELTNRLIGLAAIRVLVVASVLLSYLVHTPVSEGDTDGTLIQVFDSVWHLMAPDSPPLEGPPAPSSEQEDLRGRVLQTLVAMVSVQTLIYLALLRLLQRRQHLQAWIQLSGDLLLLTLLVYRFGSATANLSILYLVVISVGSFLLRGRGGLGVAAMAMVFYASALFAQQSDGVRALWKDGGIFAPAPTVERVTGEPVRESLAERTLGWLTPPAEEQMSGVPIAYSLAIHFVGFFVVALFTTHLARDQALELKLEQRSQDLEALKTLHRDVVHSISSGLAATDLDGIATSLNRAGAGILGLSEEELVGRHIIESGLFDLETWRRVSTDSDQGTLRSELELQRGDNRTHIGFSISHLRDAHGLHHGFILIFQDLTEWRQLQEQVRVQDRMAAVGQMAAGLAHEVGNPLAAISGSVQMLARTAKPSSSQAKLLEITLKESRRLDRTVKSFLQFARPRERHLQEFDVAALLEEDAQLLRLGDDVLPNHEIVLDLVPESATIVAELDQIGQLFWNLARNALQAMPEGGRLTISGLLVADTYRIRFADTGRGMTPEEQAKLFQPFKSFFDSGLGLGMAIVYRIVEEHSGEIRINSEPDQGTEITVELPVRPSSSTPMDHAQAQEVPR
ncbi:MAG: ATP-binding protein [Acidobacteriota bacterium]